MDKGIRVTVTDLETGEEQTVEIVDDYLLLCVGSCHVSSIQTYGTGTHQFTIKGRRHDATKSGQSIGH